MNQKRTKKQSSVAQILKKRVLPLFMATALCVSLTGCSDMELIRSIVKNQSSIFMVERNGGVTEDEDVYILTDGDVEFAYEEAQSMDIADVSGYMDGGFYTSSKAAGFALGQEEYWPGEPDWNTEEYSYQEENHWMSAKTSPFSTFAADVDTASYANLRRMILRGEEIPADAVRIEEMVNYFSYDYPEPKDGEPFSVTTELAPCPWSAETELLLIGLQAKELEMEERPASNLVFLIDVSGSMDESDKLPLVQRSIHLLTEHLESSDRVSIVTYADGDEIVLEGVSGEKQAEISTAMEDLMAGGGTNGSAGIQTAYAIAEKYFIPGGNNRIILATDGDLNIGITDEGSLTRLIQEKAKSGVFLSVLGFGTGNISDTNMEALADHGNGNYSYIDSVSEARKVLIEEMGATLFTVARDVKLQVEFNPAKVKGYRLIGYENRTIAAEDFADDTKDGGEIGAGHRVTALYEIARADSTQEIPEVTSRYQDINDSEKTEATSNTETAEQEVRNNHETEISSDTDTLDRNTDTDVSEELLAVNIRYKDPDGAKSRLLTYPVTDAQNTGEMSENLSWAAGVAQIGMLLKDSPYAGTTQLEEVRARLNHLESTRDDDYRQEFVYLIKKLDLE